MGSSSSVPIDCSCDHFRDFVNYSAKDRLSYLKQCDKSVYKTRDVENGSLLHIAAQLGDATCLRYLLAGGASTNLVDGDGRTALHVAANCGHDNCVSLLLDNVFVPCVDKQDLWGWTVIHRAVIQRHWLVAQHLLTHGCDISIADGIGRTVLHTAACYGNNELIQQLISADACINCQDVDGRTPLYLAVVGRHIHTVDLVCQLGCDMDLATYQSNARPLHVAAARGDLQCSSLLIRYGACCDSSVLQPVLARARENRSAEFMAVAKMLIAAGADTCDTNLLNIIESAEVRTCTTMRRLLFCANGDVPTALLVDSGFERPLRLLDICRQTLRTLCKHATAAGNIFYLSNLLSIPTRLRHIITLCDIEPDIITAFAT